VFVGRASEESIVFALAGLKDLARRRMLVFELACDRMLVFELRGLKGPVNVGRLEPMISKMARIGRIKFIIITAVQFLCLLEKLPSGSLFVRHRSCIDTIQSFHNRRGVSDAFTRIFFYRFGRFYI